MIEQAQDLKNLHEETQRQAKKLLDRLVLTNSIGCALMGYEIVEGLLPTTRWIPDRAEFPLIREHLDNYDHFRREGVYSFIDMFEEEIWYFTDATEEEQQKALQNDYGWNPHEKVPLLWEIIKSGYGKFRFDW